MNQIFPFPLERLSISKVKEFLNCQRKYQYRHIDKLVPRMYQRALEFGTVGHKFLELFYTAMSEGKLLEFDINEAFDKISKTNQFDGFDAASSQQWNLDLFVIRGMIEAYVQHYRSDENLWEILSVEKDFLLGKEGDYGGASFSKTAFRGKPDLIVRNKSDGKIWVVDHKFLAQISAGALKKLPMDYQIHAYIKMFNQQLEAQGSKERVAGAIYNIVKKSGKRLKKNQTPSELAREMFDDYTETPSDYFHREYVIVTEHNTKSFDAFIAQASLDMHDKHFTGRFSQNINACDTYGECPYIELCLRGKDAEFLYRKLERPIDVSK